jgi:hypothetical protein
MNNGPRGRVIRAIAGAGIILVASLGSVLAANIAIGDSENTTEFGQGEFTLKACDSWIQLNLSTGATGQYGAPSGLSALTGITIHGLDVSQCKSTQFTIQALDESMSPMPLYRTDGKTSLCSATPCKIGTSTESDLVVQVSSSGVVTLSGPNQFHSMSFDDTYGIYSIQFARSAQLAADINDLIIQSSSI